MKTSKILTLRELMKGKQIYLSAERLNSIGSEGCGNSVLSEAEHFVNTFIYAAKQRADDRILCGPLILQERSGMYEVVQEEEPIILHFIFLAAVINELHQRNMLTAEVHCIFEDLLKCETVYRIHLDKVSNQFFRDCVIDGLVNNENVSTKPSQKIIQDLFETYKDKLKFIDKTLLTNLPEMTVNAEFDVVYK